MARARLRPGSGFGGGGGGGDEPDPEEEEDESNTVEQGTENPFNNYDGDTESSSNDGGDGGGDSSPGGRAIPDEVFDPPSVPNEDPSGGDGGSGGDGSDDEGGGGGGRSDPSPGGRGIPDDVYTPPSVPNETGGNGDSSGADGGSSTGSPGDSGSGGGGEEAGGEAPQEPPRAPDDPISDPMERSEVSTPEEAERFVRQQVQQQNEWADPGEDFEVVEQDGQFVAQFTERGQEVANLKAAEKQVKQQYPDLTYADDFTVGLTENDKAEVTFTQSGRKEVLDTQQELQNAAAAATSGSGELARTTPDIQTVEEELAAERERRQENTLAHFERGNLGDTQEIREEMAAEQVSEQTGVPVTSEDISLTEGENGKTKVELDEEAQRAAMISSTSEFLRRDAEVTREDGQLAVELPGDSDSMEEALTQRIQTGEAFGGETKVSVPGVGTLNIEQATEDFAAGVEDVAADAGDFADRFNLFSPDVARPNEEANQDLVGATSTTEASEDTLIQTLEGAAVSAGEIPGGLLELGETATDPLAYEVGAEASMMGVRRLDDINFDTVSAAGQGAIETAERVDAAARKNPEAAASAVSSVLGGALLSAGSYAAAPAALSRLGSVSPTAARTAEVALDPVRTSAQAGARAARRVDPPDPETLQLGKFSDDTRAMAQLTGPQRSSGSASDGSAETTDDDLGVPDDDPFRVSDKRLYDPSRTFDEATDPNVNVDPTDRSGVAEQDIGSGVAGQGNPQAAPGTDLEWDVGADSDNIRRTAERLEVGKLDADFGDLIRTAEARRADTDTGVAGLLEVTPEGAFADALAGDDVLDGSALNDPAASREDADTSGGVDVVVNPGTRSAGEADASAAAAASDAASVLDDDLMGSFGASETVTAMDGVREVATATEFEAHGRSGTPDLPQLDDNLPQVEAPATGEVEEKTFTYDVASPSEIADGLDDSSNVSLDGSGSLDIDTGNDSGGSIDIDIDLDI